MSKGMFLDRDGVINEVLTNRVKFVNQPRDFHLLEGAGEAIRVFNDLGYYVFVVTNQGGIGLGYMQEAALTEIHHKMKSDLETFGASIDDIAYCPHKPHAGCPCRKPKPQMILDLAEKHQIDLYQSYMTGDRKPDIEAGKQAGVKTVLLGGRDDETTTPDAYFSDLLAFADWLKKQ
ncbi:D-glycero-alpha-D-manno-heptose-1,7-bisphosphate 7-phosphatase [Lentibacillus amyloliquefaciens]|uniref:D,D-heptose 1,7-bisphosphate phosphatase n=1 Tax=Lentibacillus amyloliquefaciens TaxID=1472767 RepID=A0A0U4EGG9_9BACI|nr:HAD family hydrolase [Lentibacillus amyloliquefaciens]ALX49609.1 histidinol-phosphatase [Lentibacillus amyloliquefaciens]